MKTLLRLGETMFHEVSTVSFQYETVSFSVRTAFGFFVSQNVFVQKRYVCTGVVICIIIYLYTVHVINVMISCNSYSPILCYLKKPLTLSETMLWGIKSNNSIKVSLLPKTSLFKRDRYRCYGLYDYLFIHCKHNQRIYILYLLSRFSEDWHELRAGSNHRHRSPRLICESSGISLQLFPLGRRCQRQTDYVTV